MEKKLFKKLCASLALGLGLGSGEAFAKPIAVVLGAPDEELEFVSEMLSERVDIIDRDDSDGFSTEAFSILNQYGVTQAKAIAVVAETGAGSVLSIAKGVEAVEESVAVVPVVSTPRVTNQICQAMRSKKETAFVLSAGNMGLNLNRYLAQMPECAAKNILIVAAESEKLGELASFSSFGNEIVRLAAPGIEQAAITKGGDLVLRSGTLVASVIASAKLWTAAQANPETSGAELIDLLLGSEMVESEVALSDTVKNGLRLVD